MFEATFELRFRSKQASVGDLLPGLLFATLGSEYPNVETLPVASVPRSIRDMDPELKYQPSHRLRGSTGSIQVGDRVLSILTWQYPGWSALKPSISSLIKAADSTALISDIERFSFKYTNVLAFPDQKIQLDALAVSIQCLGGSAPERGLQLRMERDSGDFTSIVQIVTNATANHNVTGRKVAGILLDLDTIRIRGPALGNTIPDETLDAGHLVAKELFFSLLTDESIDRLQPEW